MKIINPSYEIIDYDKQALKKIEKIARICYKSEEKITAHSSEKFIQNIIIRGHEAMIEHSSITVKFICNRGFSHELVRHRIASFAQESTRYCNYSKKDEIEVVAPYWFATGKAGDIMAWKLAMESCEKKYLTLIKGGLPPQAARGVLPIDLKTEIVITANLREWRSIFKLRTDSAAHPDMQRLMKPVLQQFKTIISIIFDDIDCEAQI